MKIHCKLDELSASQKRLAKTILSYLKKWIPILGLAHYNFYLTFELEKDGQKRASIVPSWEYRQANIYFILPTMAVDSTELIESNILHELIHILVEPLVSKKTPIELLEMTVVDLTAAFMRMEESK